MKDKLTVSSSKILPPRGDIRVEFTGKNLTKFGGIQLVKKFLRGLRVKEELESAVGIEKRDGKFTVGGMLICLIYALSLDMKRQSDTLMLRLDKVFQKIAGLDDYPARISLPFTEIIFATLFVLQWVAILMKGSYHERASLSMLQSKFDEYITTPW